jgi:Glycosyl hydrolase catalytic core
VNPGANLHRRAAILGAVVALAGTVAAGARAAGLSLGQSQVGDVFFTTETLRFPAQTQTAADQLDWNVTDFGGHTVASGTTPVAGGTATITPALGARTGYFLLHVIATLQGAPAAAGSAAFAVVTPFLPPTGSPFGVMTHYAQGWDPATIPLLARLGVGSARDEVYWSVEQPTAAPPGPFTFGPPYDPYLSAFAAAGIDPMIELNGGSVSGNPNYDQGLTPYTLSGFDGFANYCWQVLNHYRPQIPSVEIWNEYNGTWCTGPAANNRAADYLQLLEAADQRIKASFPGVTVVGGSTSGVPLPYLDQLFRAGALNYLDAVSVHPYRYASAPEGIEDDINRLQVLIRQDGGGSPKPVWVTEFGWFTNPNPWPGQIAITEADQAKFLVRGYALLLAAGVARAYWYDLLDGAGGPPLGLLRAADDPLGAYAPKPAYAAMATLTRQLSGAVFVRIESTLNGVYSVLFDRDGQELRILWSVNPGTTAFTAAATGAVTTTDLMGNASALQPAGGLVTLELTDEPVYVLGQLQSLPAPDATLLADSAADFSDQQGWGNWYYGYFKGGAAPGPYSAGSFVPMDTYTSDDWNYRWNGPSQWLEIMSGQQQPGTANHLQQWAVRRWVSPVAGTVRLQGRFDATSNQGDGVHARIFVDGQSVFEQQLSAGTVLGAAFDLPVGVHQGSDVDFAVDPGPGTDDSYDATLFSVRITRAVSGTSPAVSPPAGAASATPARSSTGGGGLGLAGAAGWLSLLGLRVLAIGAGRRRPAGPAAQLSATNPPGGGPPVPA